MKLEELEEGQIAQSVSIGMQYMREGDELFERAKVTDEWKPSTADDAFIRNTNVVVLNEWALVKKDTPVYVGNHEMDDFLLERHFCKYEDNTVFVYPHGETSWTHGGDRLEVWQFTRLATKEEIGCE